MFVCTVLGIHEGRCRRALCACGVGEQVRIPWRARGRSGRRLVRFRAEASRRPGRGCALGVSLEGLARTTACFWPASTQARAVAISEERIERYRLRWDVMLLEMRNEGRWWAYTCTRLASVSTNSRFYYHHASQHHSITVHDTAQHSTA